MTNERITLLKTASAEIEEKKSRFIGHASPVKNESEAQKFIADIKNRYSDATHNVFAYYINGGACARCSDDGEPQGSSGYPTLNALKTSGADDLCVVVTRYFGGTLLGTAGLARSYAAAARAAIDAAGFARYGTFTICRVSVGYGEYQKLSVKLGREGIKEDSADFTDCVTIMAAVPEDKLAETSEYVRDITQGRGKFEKIGEEERLIAI